MIVAQCYPIAEQHHLEPGFPTVLWCTVSLPCYVTVHSMFIYSSTLLASQLLHRGRIMNLSAEKSLCCTHSVSEIKAWQQVSFEIRASCICLTLCARLDGSVFLCSWCVVENEGICMFWKYIICSNYVKLLICFFTETSCSLSQSSETWCIRYYKG